MNMNRIKELYIIFDTKCGFTFGSVKFKCTLCFKITFSNEYLLRKTSCLLFEGIFTFLLLVHHLIFHLIQMQTFELTRVYFVYIKNSAFG